jgi:hypothetical protein
MNFLLEKKIKSELQLLYAKLKKINKFKDNPNISKKGFVTKLIGRVINIGGPFVEELFQEGKLIKSEYFCLGLDCGDIIIKLIVSKSWMKKNKIELESYIWAEGRLDVDLLDIDQFKEKSKNEK